MPVRIRLRRVGTKKKPYYRIVAVDSRVSTRGKILDLVGHYGPIENPVKVDIDIEKVDMWIKKGAQLSDTVKSILRKAKKSQEQEKVEKKPAEEIKAQSGKGTEAQREKQKKAGKKAAHKTTSGTKAVRGKKSSKGKQVPRKSKKKLSRAH